MRCALKAALATIDRATGHPYVSLVTVATEVGGRPVLLLSRLALHTQNLLADSRASLLFDGTSGSGDPLAGGRVTLTGRMAPAEDRTSAARFIARHPAAAGYAGFADFSFLRMEVERAHFVGGFGRIVTLTSAEIISPIEDGGRFAVEERAAIEAFAAGDPAFAGNLAASLGGDRAAPWRLAGFDPEGLDLVDGQSALRASFGTRLDSPARFAQSALDLLG